MSDDRSRTRAVSYALAARALFWGADAWVAARDRELWRAWRTLQVRSSRLRWRDYESVHAARSAHLDDSAVTWGDTPLSSARAALTTAGVGPRSAVLDLGAGVGAFLLAARSLGARARGVELVRSRVACGAPALLPLGAVLEEGDVRSASLVEPWAPTHVVLSWTTWPEALRAEVAARLTVLAQGTRVLAFTHAPRGFTERSRLRVHTLASALDAFVVERP